MRLTAVFVLAAPIASVMSDAISVEEDITQRIVPQTTTLDNDVKGYPASGLSGALSIHSDIQGLVAAIFNSTNNVKSSGSFSEADGTAILTDLQSWVSTFLGTLEAIGAQASDWANFPGGQALALTDLKELDSNTIDFTDSIAAASPADLVPAVTSVKTQLVGGFESAIAAYSS